MIVQQQNNARSLACLNEDSSSMDEPLLINNHIDDTESVIPTIIFPRSPLVNLLANLKQQQKLTRRSHSAPPVITDVKVAFHDFSQPRPAKRSTSLIVWQAFIAIVLYAIVGIAVYVLKCGSFKGNTTFKLVDALYFTVVTSSTIGYGDIVPNTTFTKLFTCAFILTGFGFIVVLLNGLVTYILDRQEEVFLSRGDENRFNMMVIDISKGRMRIRMKVGLALAVVVGCIALGTVAVHLLERSWVDSFYLSVTTVGYGDYAFSTLRGRCFAIIWLLISTLAVARAFLYLTEPTIEKRNHKVAKWILQKKMTLGDLMAAEAAEAADLNRDGSIRYNVSSHHK